MLPACESKNSGASGLTKDAAGTLIQDGYQYLSDSWVPVVVSSVALAVATLGCAIAGNIESLWLFRTLQGLSSGAGLVVGRAIIQVMRSPAIGLADRRPALTSANTPHDGSTV